MLSLLSSGSEFDPSIHEWVKSSLPGARYESFEDKSINEIPISKYLLDETGSRHFVVLQAQKGMGKSSRGIRPAVANLPSYTSVLNITFRRVLARGVSAELEGGISYLECEDDRYDPISHRVLTILINSLHRVDGTYDVLIIDELVSVLEMGASQLIPEPTRITIMSTLTRLLKSARVIVVSDALLFPEAITPLVAASRSAHTRLEVSVLDYLHRNHADYTYISHASRRSWLKELGDQLSSGKRIVVPCMTKTFAGRVRDIVKTRYPEKNVLHYDAESPHDMDEHMKFIDNTWSEFDVVIYSPVITAGCSFEVQGHFDTCFLYAFAGTASVRSALQMSFRVRDLAEKRIHVVIESFNGKVPFGAPEAPNLEGVSRFILKTSQESIARAKSDMDTSIALMDAVRALGSLTVADSRKRFPIRFWEMVLWTGVKIVALGEENVADPKLLLRLRRNVPPTQPSGCSSSVLTQRTMLGSIHSQSPTFPMHSLLHKVFEGTDHILSSSTRWGGMEADLVVPQWARNDVFDVWTSATLKLVRKALYQTFVDDRVSCVIPPGSVSSFGVRPIVSYCDPDAPLSPKKFGVRAEVWPFGRNQLAWKLSKPWYSTQVVHAMWLAAMTECGFNVQLEDQTSLEADKLPKSSSFMLTSDKRNDLREYVSAALITITEKVKSFMDASASGAFGLWFGLYGDARVPRIMQPLVTLAGDEGDVTLVFVFSSDIDTTHMQQLQFSRVAGACAFTAAFVPNATQVQAKSLVLEKGEVIEFTPSAWNPNTLCQILSETKLNVSTVPDIVFFCTRKDGWVVWRRFGSVEVGLSIEDIKSTLQLANKMRSRVVTWNGVLDLLGKIPTRLLRKVQDVSMHFAIHLDSKRTKGVGLTKKIIAKSATNILSRFNLLQIEEARDSIRLVNRELVTNHEGDDDCPGNLVKWLIDVLQGSIMSPYAICINNSKKVQVVPLHTLRGIGSFLSL